MEPRLKKKEKTSEVFEGEWRFLQDSFEELKNFISNGYKVPHQTKVNKKMEAYTVVYNLCTKSSSTKGGATTQKELYHRCRNMIKQHLRDNVTEVVVDKTGDALLLEVHKEWKAHNLVARWVRFMFTYLDQYYTIEPQIDNLATMMLRCFHDAVFEKIKSNLRNVVLDNIESEREGNSINQECLRSAIWLFIDMGMATTEVYQEEFENHFLTSTKRYYERLSAQWLGEDGGKWAYLRKTEARMQEEARRADLYLAPSTKGQLLKTLDQALLANCLETCLQDPDAGCQALLKTERNEELGRMYRLFSRVDNGLSTMADIVREYIEKEGKTLNSAFSTGGPADGGEPASTTYIKACLTLHDKYSSLFADYLNNHEEFLKARKTAFETFVNPQQSDAWVLKQRTAGKDTFDVVTASELLSTYLDSLMKKEIESEEQLDSTLDRCVTLFTYIHDKDLFQQFYMKQMSRRLMHNKNDRLRDQERQFISKLKMKMGSVYTTKLEGMLTDQGTTEQQGAHFRNWMSTNDHKLPCDFTPQILTTGFWPAFKHDTLVPPPDMQTCLAFFAKFYDKTTQSRKLTWIHSLGSAVVTKKFTKGPREMSVTTYQACVLLLFNETGIVNAKEAQETLKLPFDEIKRTIHSLAYGKFPVVKPQDDKKTTKAVRESDNFIINEAFTTNSRKFKIPAAVKQERETIIDTNQERRRHVIEACIVRIMKSRHRLKHTEVVTETIKQLSHLFTPEPRVIKKRIEDLIQRQYIERDETDRN
eukprot:gene22430-34356_t